MNTPPSAPEPSSPGPAPDSTPVEPPTAALPPEVKARFRADWRDRRRALPEEDRAAQSARITEHLLDWYLPRARHRRVAVVMSYGAEPDTGPLRRRLHESGVEVLVPVTEPGRQLAWVRWYPGVPVERSAVAPIDEPVGERLGPQTMTAVDVVMVPAQTVDGRGYRMGQGGGYYDRFLARLKDQEADRGDRPVTVAVVYRHELVTAGVVPAEPLDEPVDGALTADGFVWFTDRGQV